MIIDFHTHIFPEKIAESAISSLAQRSGLAPSYSGTLDGLIRSMNDAGIEQSIALPIATKIGQTESINNFAIAVNQSTNRVISFGTMHPDYADFRNELKRLKDNHICGIKMHPVYQNFYVNDERVFPIYEYAEELGLIVLLHAGMDIGFPGVKKCTPIRCRRVIDRFKKLKLVLAHMGGYELWDDVETYIIGEDVYIDTSFSSHLLEPERMCSMIRKHGTDKVLFGTDGPWGRQTEEIERIKSLGLTQEELNDVCYLTAQKLLSIKANETKKTMDICRQ